MFKFNGNLLTRVDVVCLCVVSESQEAAVIRKICYYCTYVYSAPTATADPSLQPIFTGYT